jgi:hypothetical protein
MPHLPPAHHKTSKHNSPNETKIKVKLLKCPGFEFKTRQVNDSLQSNQGTDHLISQSPPWWVHWQQKTQILKFESKTPWSTVRRPKKPRKAQECQLEEGKTATPTKGIKSDKPRKRAKKLSKSKNSTLRLKSTPPNTLNAWSPAYIVIYHVSSLNHLISKSSINFVHNLSPFGNELIKHKLREERDAMHEIQNKGTLQGIQASI